MTGPLVAGKPACLVANGCCGGGKHESWWFATQRFGGRTGRNRRTGRHARRAGKCRQRHRFHKTECLLAGWFRREAVPFRQSVSQSSLGHSATRLSQLLPSSCIFPRCCRYTIPRTPCPPRYCGSCPALDGPGHGPFCRIFLFFPNKRICHAPETLALPDCVGQSSPARAHAHAPCPRVPPSLMPQMQGAH